MRLFAAAAALPLVVMSSCYVEVDNVVDSIFRRTRQSTKQNVSSAIAFREVWTLDQLTGAIGDAIASDTPRGIIVVADFDISEGIVIPATARGLVITAAPGVTLTSTVVSGPVFDVQGLPFSISDVILQRVSGTQECISSDPALGIASQTSSIELRNVSFVDFQSPLFLAPSGGFSFCRIVAENLCVGFSEDSGTATLTLNGNLLGSVRNVAPLRVLNSIDLVVGGSRLTLDTWHLGDGGAINVSGNQNHFVNIVNNGGLTSGDDENYFINVSDTAGAGGTDVVL